MKGAVDTLQALQVTEAELADGDSKFRELGGLTVHFKAAAPGSLPKAPGRAPCGLAMYHGFGANTFSWSFVDRRLAEELGATVVSHDMPGFGLTQRSVHSTAPPICCRDGLFPGEHANTWHGHLLWV